MNLPTQVAMVRLQLEGFQTEKGQRMRLTHQRVLTNARIVAKDLQKLHISTDTFYRTHLLSRTNAISVIGVC